MSLFTHKTPSHTSFRRWLNQVGYYILEILPLEQANDWIFIIDNSIRTENRKACLVLGVRQSQLQKGKALSFKDMRVINLRLINKSKDVESVIEESIRKAGKPISICSDLGPDVMPSIRKILKAYKGIEHVPDMTHKAGNMLKKQLEKDENWNEFIKNVNSSKNRLKQSSLSFLCPPNIRGKSRFLNCKDVIYWALRVTEMLKSGDKNDPSYETLMDKLGWTLIDQKKIEYFAELFELAAIAKELVRKMHIDKNVWKEAKKQLKEGCKSSKGEKFAQELEAFLKEQGKKVNKVACLVGCSEIIESAMSKLKLLDREYGNSGYTRSILGLAACFGSIDSQMIAKAFDVVSEKKVKEWADRHIGQTMQSKRRQILKNIDRTKWSPKLIWTDPAYWKNKPKQTWTNPKIIKQEKFGS